MCFFMFVVVVVVVVVVVMVVVVSPIGFHSYYCSDQLPSML